MVDLNSTMNMNVFSSRSSTMFTSNVLEKKQGAMRTRLLTIPNTTSIQSESAKHIQGKELPQFLL